MKRGFWKRWLAVCGIVVATGAAVPVLFYAFGWVAHVNEGQKSQDTSIVDMKQTNKEMNQKMDQLISATGEIKGTLQQQGEILKVLVRNSQGPTHSSEVTVAKP